MRKGKLLVLILIVCILGFLVKISEYSFDRASARQNIRVLDNEVSSSYEPELALLVQLLSGGSINGSTWEK